MFALWPELTLLTLLTLCSCIKTIVYSVCHLLKSGVAALFGPESGTTSSHVQSICDAMEIPHIETRWDFLTKRDDYSINLYPSPKQISKVGNPMQPACHTAGLLCNAL
jgi:hypothetical protein